jgi:hypothetical protein
VEGQLDEESEVMILMQKRTTEVFADGRSKLKMSMCNCCIRLDDVGLLEIWSWGIPHTMGSKMNMLWNGSRITVYYFVSNTMLLF